MSAKVPSSKGTKASKKGSSVEDLPEWLNETVELFDFDCNLTHPEFNGQTDMLIESARKLRVTKMLVPGATIEESQQCLDLAKKHPTIVFPTAGVHPYNATKPFDANEFELLTQIAGEPEIVCVGECGLDYSEGFPSREHQLAWFQPQLTLACSLKKPLFLHERLAHDSFIEALQVHHGNLPPACVHCFTGTATEMKTYLEMGFYIGITGFICKPHGAALQSMLRDGLLPLDRIVVETDAPYMGFSTCRQYESTSNKRQYPNVPTSLPKIVQVIAECLNISTMDVAMATTQNASRFLRLF